MDYPTERLILRIVTEDDLDEVARTWPAVRRPIALGEARDSIARIRKNRAANKKGRIRHLCLAVCAKADPGVIMGWCGLDGSRSRTEPEVFVLLDEPYRGRGFGTECVKELLRIATEDFSLESVHGGCAKENIASARAMEKAGMVRCGEEDNGDPVFKGGKI